MKAVVPQESVRIKWLCFQERREYNGNNWDISEAALIKYMIGRFSGLTHRRSCTGACQDSGVWGQTERQWGAVSAVCSKH